MDRRQFLVGLFGTAVVAAAGPIPQKLLEVTEDEFAKRAMFFASLKPSGWPEIYSNEAGVYSFIPLPGFRSMREESDRIGALALNILYAEFR